MTHYRRPTLTRLFDCFTLQEGQLQPVGWLLTLCRFCEKMGQNGVLINKLITERINEGRVRAMAAGVKFGRKPKLTKTEEESLATWIREDVLSKEDLAEKFNVSVSTIYRRMVSIKNSTHWNQVIPHQAWSKMMLMGDFHDQICLYLRIEKQGQKIFVKNGFTIFDRQK